ncbi:MAG TPA: K(+)-transporting ATPase subunit F [Prolixibacteraceae bacterium]|jgi:K+-transporting ATPase KdpF subunit
MKTFNFIIGAVPSVLDRSPKTVEMNSIVWYAIGMLIALILLAYLVYALVKPEKF